MIRRELYDGLTSPVRGEPIAPPTLPTLWRTGEAWRGRVEAAQRSGRAERVRRGLYGPPSSPAAGDDALLAAIVAVGSRMSTAFAISHRSAGLLAGLWVPPRHDAVVEVTQVGPISSTAHADVTLRRYRSDLPHDEIRDFLGLPVTSVERTAVDCARTLPLARALAVVDSALVIGADRGEMERILHRLRGRRGVRAAREIVALGQPTVGSPAESVVRAEIVAAGLPVPSTLVVVDTPGGAFELDMGWIDQKVGVEVHGRGKYLRGADPVSEAVRREHVFEAGWSVVDVRTGQPAWHYLPRVRRALEARA
ncbi:hypothetical protein SERN_0390 [Serinibacter arcticus]|uniref:Transcriptional regulator, AbiEi antitoxin, Type IV TA system n=1 Tax=Serinibacter arcticus TaxID=1655435 RepID=A0A4Z1E5P4_9MICO|nr:hypothetical protein SERN_0390 [Serinibacter arcticus]